MTDDFKGKKMSLFKKFTDFVGGIGAFFATLYFMGQYMAYDPGELEEGVSKLDKFLSADGPREYRQYVIWVLLVALSIACSILLKKYPAITLSISALQFIHIMNCIYISMVYDHKEFYIFVSAIVFCGNLFEAVHTDKKEGRRQTFCGAGIFGVFSIVLSAAALFISSFVKSTYEKFLNSELTEEELDLERLMKALGIDIIKEVPEKEADVLLFVIIALAVGVVISYLLKEVYFIDVITAAVPFVYVVFAFHAEKLSTVPMLTVFPVCSYFVCRLALMVTGKEIADK